MSQITITEALAEIKTIGKRVEKKQEFILNYLYRQDFMKDPHQAAGGSGLLIAQEMQSIKDLRQRVVDIRVAINEANRHNTITIAGDTRSIAEWLIWRREIFPLESGMLSAIVGKMSAVRQEAMRKGVIVTTAEVSSPNDIVMNINERDVKDQVDHLEQIVGQLDGQLSLKNATVMIEL